MTENDKAQCRAMAHTEEIRGCIKMHLRNYRENLVRCVLLKVQKPAPLLISDSDPALSSEIHELLTRFIDRI